MWNQSNDHKQKPAEWKSSVVSIMVFMWHLRVYSCWHASFTDSWRTVSSAYVSIRSRTEGSRPFLRGTPWCGPWVLLSVKVKANIMLVLGSNLTWTHLVVLQDWNEVNEDKVHHTQTHSGPVEGHLLSWTSICPRHPSSAPPCRSEPAGPPRSGTWRQMRRSVKNLRTQRTLTWAQCSPTATVFSADWSERRQWHHSEGPPPDPAEPDQDPSQPDQMEMLERIESRKQTGVNLTVFYCSHSHWPDHHCHQTCDSSSQSAASDSGPSWDTGLDGDFLFTQLLVVLYVNNWPIRAEHVN